MLKYNYCTYKGDNQMTENTYILAVDPGNEKTGVAILSPSGEMICRKIISSNTFNKDIERILTEPNASLTLQYRELIKTEGVEVEFTQDGISKIAESAFRVNEKTENIGARRLHTVLERLMDGISFDASERAGEKIVIDEKYVSES